MIISDITNYIEEIAPLPFQESYDNAGLIVGNKNSEITGVLITLDVTEDVVQDAINQNLNLIIAHHPIVFSGLKKINGNNYVERTVIKAIKNDIAIYAAHTNIDSVLYNGVNSKICEKLGLEKTKILAPSKENLNKVVVFVPHKNADEVRKAMLDADAGKIGNYDSCTFNLQGHGTFKAGENASPHIGEINKVHTEPETRIETVVPNHLLNKVISAMIKAHPYEEVAHDIYDLKNTWSQVGAGMIGELPEAIETMEFLKNLKKTFNCDFIRHTQLTSDKIKKVAVCGGAGSFLLKDAIRAKADIFITGDFKYHQFFDAENHIIIADIGHFESEQYTKELFFELLTRKFSNFAIRLTKVNTNPIKYL
ncbi:MAG: Nif3-like dinuclear metal center hexameric protein [Salinivirgaceae bacterium]|nr:Nif3-like dinuclear metal center hexameric protein [Salinivirgaceae bacterium]